MRLADFLMESYEEFCLQAFDEIAGGGSQENRAALALIARLVPRTAQGIWCFADDRDAVVPNRAERPAASAIFVPNRQSVWGDTELRLKPAAAVGLSHLIPVYAVGSRCAITVSAP